MANSKKSGNFLKQAGILAAAGLLSRVIGLLYRVPITRIIGKEGNGYYGSAYEIYAVILLISSYSIPMAVSKIIAERLALKEYRNADRIFKCSLIYVVIVGGLASIITFIFAKQFVDVEGAVLPLRIMAPTIFFSGILSVFRGYFQAYNTMVPTSISQVMEQVLNCIVSIVAAYLFVAAATDPAQIPVVGAAGSAIGTGAGVLIGLIFMLAVYILNRKTIKKYLRVDKTKKEDTYGDIFKIILLMVTPVIFATAVYNISTSLDMKIYYWIMGIKGYTDKEMATFYGVFTGEVRVLQNVPIAIASAISSAMIPGIAGSFAKGDMDRCRNSVNTAIRGTMFVTIPAAVGLAALSYPIIELLFKDSDPMASNLLIAGSVSIILYALSTVSNGALQGIGKVQEPLKNAVISLIIHIIVLIPLLLFTELNLYAIMIATIVYALTMCILNQISIRKYIGYKQEFVKSFIAPLFASLVMGVVAYLVFTLVHMIIKSNAIGLIISIPIAAMIYFIIALKIDVFNEEDLMKIPKGGLIIKFAKKLRLI